MRFALVFVSAFVFGISFLWSPSASAAVAPAGVGLPLPGYSKSILDESRNKLFVSSGPSGSSVVVVNTQTAGLLPATVNNLPGANGMALSVDSTRLYVALSTGDAIAVLDTVTNAEVGRFPTGPQTCPTDLARTGTTQIWFSYGCPGALNGKIGLLDLTKPAASAIVLDAQGTTKFSRAPLLSSSGGAPLVAAQPGTSLSNVVVFVSTTATPTGGLTLNAGAADNVGGSGVTDFVVSPDGKTLYTAAGSRDRAEAFSTGDLSGQGAYSARPRPNAIASNPAGTYVAVGAQTGDGNDVHVYRPGSSTPVTTHSLVPGAVVAPRGLTFARNLDTLYVITQRDGNPRPFLVTITAAATL